MPSVKKIYIFNNRNENFVETKQCFEIQNKIKKKELIIINCCGSGQKRKLLFFLFQFIFRAFIFVMYIYRSIVLLSQDIISFFLSLQSFLIISFLRYLYLFRI